jgi:hypothetical protein
VSLCKSGFSLAALTGLLVTSNAIAQNPAGPTIGRVAPGAFVRARTDADRPLAGRFVPVGDGRLGIRSDQGVTDTLHLGELRELSVRGRHTKTAAIIGGIAGVAAGIFVGVMVNGVCETDDCRGARPYLIAIPAFGAGGALLGAAVGSAFPKWKRVFP